MQIYITENPIATQKIAEEFVRLLMPGDCIALYGNLGSGKTTFVQGMAKGFGINRRIISPTFVIVRTYRLKQSNVKYSDSSSFNFYHADLYRLQNSSDAKEAGLLEIMSDSKGITAIEWPDKIAQNLPQNRWEVNIELIDEAKRKILINKLK